MWLVEFESDTVEREVEALIRTQKITRADQIIIHAWIRQVAYHGPESLRGDFNWADHALVGEWRGYRSSAFSIGGRIIYRIVDNRVLVQIARVTHDHDYRKGKKR
jgi:mRNA-degrading endonuclease YafQ of YafQ-DinJ toxin-antitoxin module